MPRTKPTTKLGVYGSYDLTPVKAVDKFTDSKLLEKYYIKEPYWDIAREGLELSAVKNEREYVVMSKIQDEMRHQAITNTKLNANRIAEMVKVEEELREKFIFVNDFIRDCEEKARSADEKIVEENKVQDKMRQDIKQVTEDLEILEAFYNKLVTSVAEYQPYEDVIKKVVAESELYKNVKDLVDRCDALMLAQVEISEMEKEKIQAIDDMRLNLINATNEAELTVMGLNNELTKLEQCYAKAQADSFKWEKILEMTKECIAEKERLHFRLLDQIQQLYKLFCNRNGDDVIFKREEVEGQLDYIKQETDILKDVIRLSRIRIAKEKKSTIATKGTKK